MSCLRWNAKLDLRTMRPWSWNCLWTAQIIGNNYLALGQKITWRHFLILSTRSDILHFLVRTKDTMQFRRDESYCTHHLGQNRFIFPFINLYLQYFGLRMSQNFFLAKYNYSYFFLSCFVHSSKNLFKYEWNIVLWKLKLKH